MAIAPHLSTIVPLEEKDFTEFFSYLDSHLCQSGRNGIPLFQPANRGTAGYPAEKQAGFIQGLNVPLGEPRWRRAWRAIDNHGQTLGHLDLRAHPEPCTEHRALLGMGVRNDMSRKGIGTTLLEFGLVWALANTSIEIIDLTVMAKNFPAVRLYEKAGFVCLCQINDMFRIDGRSEGHLMMTKKLR